MGVGALMPPEDPHGATGTFDMSGGTVTIGGDLKMEAYYDVDTAFSQEAGSVEIDGDRPAAWRSTET